MDSLTFYDVYRADTEQLERRLAQLQMVRELREERRRLAAGSGLSVTPGRLPRLRRWLRGPRGRRVARSRVTPSAPVEVA